jgi:beta-glucosidase
MYEALALANRFGLPMIVTENGTPDAAATGDSFLKPHLASVARALAEGMPVEGYFFWTLVDNYEWNHGMALKLGLFALDPTTKGRTLRPMGEAYRDIARARGF